MYQFLLISLVIISCLLIFLVLMQQGKGADAGAAFGGGASGTVFGARGAGNFLTRMTAILATLFFVNCLGLAWLIANKTAGNLEEESVIDRAIQEGVIQDLPGAANTQAPAGSDLPAAGGVTLETPDLPSDVSTTVNVDAPAGEATTVDLPVIEPQVEGVNVEGVNVDGVVNEQVDGAANTVGDVINDSIEAVNDQAQQLIIEPSEVELPELPAVE